MKRVWKSILLGTAMLSGTLAAQETTPIDAPESPAVQSSALQSVETALDTVSSPDAVSQKENGVATAPGTEGGTGLTSPGEGVAPQPSSDSAAQTTVQPEDMLQVMQNEHIRKIELIESLNLPERCRAALLDASVSMSYDQLHSYVSQPHHAYDGHTALEHARMKVFVEPVPNGKMCPECGEPSMNFNPDEAMPVWTHHYTGSGAQYSHFPLPLKVYAAAEGEMGLWEKLCHRAEVDPFNLAATLIFLGAILHTFLAPRFQRLAHRLEQRHKVKLREQKFRILHPEQRVPVSFASTICHFLGEVEVVFGLWIIPFFFVCWHYYSVDDFLRYIDHDTSFTEPLFVAVIMVIASSRPIYRLAENTLKLGASLGKGSPAAWWLSVLSIAPLLGSFITEPAAMTLGAILLSKKVYQLKPSDGLKYATLGLLFVNVSVGGTLTHFAAPPIVMVAGKWNWDLAHMFTEFGWKAIAGIVVSNLIYFFVFRKEFVKLAEVQRINSAFEGTVPTTWEDRQDHIPVWVYAVSIMFLIWTVYFAHHPAIFIGGFLFFLGFTMATPQYQNAFSIKVPLLVAFFLAGLLVLGGVQGWWMQPVLHTLSELGPETTMSIASVLTAFNDNASVTFLASTVPNLPEEIRHAIVAGAVTGGGLTVIANAPNPAGQAILGKFFKGISATMLFLWVLLPTVIFFLFFSYL